MQHTVEKQTGHIENKMLPRHDEDSRSASSATTYTSTSTTSSEKGKVRGWFRKWCPTDPNSVPGGKVDQSGGYFTYKLKEETKSLPRKQVKKRCSKQPHLEVLVEE